jgi:hypothetical protein
MTIINASLERMLEAIGENPVLLSYKYETPEVDNNPEIEFEARKHGIQEAIGLAWENALWHGKFPVEYNFYKGEKGILISVEDSGEGFDFKKVQKKFESHKKYWHRWRGYGFKCYNEPDFFVSFEKGGRKVNIAHLF